MHIIGTPRESEKQEENERQIFVLKIVLGTLAYELEKA